MIHRNRQPPVALAATAADALPLPGICTNLAVILHNMALLSGGALLWLLALKWFMIPNNILNGGLLGIAMICSYFFSFVEVGWLNLLLNLPLIWLGWRCVGTAFALYSLFGILVFSVPTDLLPSPFNAHEHVHPIWACLGAGLLAGGGSALIFRSAGTAGGFDILAVYLRNRFRWRVGRILLAFNATVLVAGGGLMGLKTLLYSLLFLTICSCTIDALAPRPTSAPLSSKNRSGHRFWLAGVWAALMRFAAPAVIFQRSFPRFRPPGIWRRFCPRRDDAAAFYPGALGTMEVDQSLEVIREGPHLIDPTGQEVALRLGDQKAG
jgi:uncharacterized membrane protein YczE